MTKPQWWSQPMRPEGDNTGSGIKNQLGRPTRLGEFAVLVREAVQNSWDAREQDADVSFRVDIGRLNERAQDWSSLLSDPALPAEQASVLNNLNEETPIITISDRGTSGLGGPLRSDRVNDSDETANFVQFLRNVGEPRDSELGGGTYGYGKGIFYRVSSASAIIVDSKNSGDPRTQRRLMGAALSEAFDASDGRRFTGRHWWGNIIDDVPDPLLNEDADEVAQKLGLPGFDAHETGTDIVIVAPDLSLEDESETLDSLAERLRGHLYWQLWPKLTTSQRPRGIEFSVCVNGVDLEMPPVTTIPVIQNFASALDEIARHRATNYELKKYQPNILGELAVDYVVANVSTHSNAAVRSILEASPLEQPYRHIARMRQAELVVDYQPMISMPTSEVGYVGVFRSSAFADDAFAAAEPPTHDVWATAGLTGANLGIVRGAKSFIEQESKALVAAKSGARTRLVQGIGKLSNELGGFLTPTLESGVSETTSRSGKKRSPKKKHKLVQDQRRSNIVLIDGEPYIDHEIRINNPDVDIVLRAAAFILLANGRRESPDSAPIGASQPSFVGWFDSDSKVELTSDQDLKLTRGSDRTLTARFSHIAGAAIKTSIEVLYV